MIEYLKKNKIILVCFFLFFILGFFLRFSKLNNEIDSQCPVQIFGAIKLHYLPVVFDDFGAHCLDNFFKTLFHGEHGIDDFFYHYISIGILDFFEISLSPRNILIMKIITNILTIIAFSIFIYILFNAHVAFFSTSLFLFNNYHIMSGKSFFLFSYGMMIYLLVILSIYLYLHKQNVVRGVFLLFVFFYAMGGQAFFQIHIFLLWFVFVLMNKGDYKKLLKNINIYSIFLKSLPFLPGIMMIGFQYYLYHRLGESNLSMLGRFMSKVSIDRSLMSKINLIFDGFKRMLEESLNFDFLIYIFVIIIIWHVFLFFKKKIGVFSYINFFFLDMIINGVAVSIANTARTQFIIIDVLVILSYYLFKLRIFQTPKLNNRIYGGLVCLFVIMNMVYAVNQYEKYEIIKPKPFKGVSYYIRSNGPKFSKVYNLGITVSQAMYCEYYYGKNYQFYMEPKRKSKYLEYDNRKIKLIFTDNEKPTINELMDESKINLIDYFVFYSFKTVKEKEEKIYEIKKHGYYKNAVFMWNGNIMATIYSKKKNKIVEKLDMIEYNDKWENHYANLDSIYEHHRIGTVNSWGMNELNVKYLK